MSSASFLPIKAALLGKTARTIKSVRPNDMPTDKIDTIAKSELQRLRESGLVAKGIEQFERKARTADAPGLVKQTSSTRLVKSQSQPAAASIEKLPAASKTVDKDSTIILPPPIEKQSQGWRQWFQLPYIPLVY